MINILYMYNILAPNLLADYIVPTTFSLEWFRQLYEYNVDSFLYWGWLVLGVLTVVSCLEMIQKIFKGYKQYNP